MDRDIFKERERGLEEGYFRAQEAKLIEKMREKAKLGELVNALAEHLQVDNPELLSRVMALGITLENGPALLVAPLIQVAWAEGNVSARERETVMRLAEGRGVTVGSPAQSQILAWLDVRPSDELFDTAMEVIKHGINLLPKELRDERIKGIVEACHQVAEASGGLSRLLGFSDGVTPEEEVLLEAISARLRGEK